MTISTKYGRTYHFPFSPGTTSDDRINHDYWQDVEQLKEVVHTEKLDGENNCLSKHGVLGGDLIFIADAADFAAGEVINGVDDDSTTIGLSPARRRRRLSRRGHRRFLRSRRHGPFGGGADQRDHHARLSRC